MVQTDVSLLCKYMDVCPRLAGSVRRTAEGYASNTCNGVHAKWSICDETDEATIHKGLYEFASEFYPLFDLFNSIITLRGIHTIGSSSDPNFLTIIL